MTAGGHGATCRQRRRRNKGTWQGQSHPVRCCSAVRGHCPWEKIPKQVTVQKMYMGTGERGATKKTRGGGGERAGGCVEGQCVTRSGYCSTQARRRLGWTGVVPPQVKAGYSTVRRAAVDTRCRQHTEAGPSGSTHVRLNQLHLHKHESAVRADSAVHPSVPCAPTTTKSTAPQRSVLPWAQGEGGGVGAQQVRRGGADSHKTRQGEQQPQTLSPTHDITPHPFPCRHHAIVVRAIRAHVRTLAILCTQQEEPGPVE
jgi:hypothetical protein